MQLNPQQRQAVRHVSSPLLVLAGAGSGKTGVITHKVAHLVRDLEVPPKRLYAVTFTNKAAREMKHRLATMLGSGTADLVQVSTFHTLGLRFLREEGHALGFSANLTIIDPTDTVSTLKALAGEARLSTVLDASVARQHLSRWKNDGQGPDEVAESIRSQADGELVELFRLYQSHLRQCNAVDFDDLLTLPVSLLDDAACRERWQARVRHLLVDEYQDTNAIQYALVRRLTGVQGRLTAVGDDDQSVYAWRGARPENLARLQEDYPTLRVIKLEQNYRSTSRILKVANTLIAHNPHVFKKALWSERVGGDTVRFMQCGTQDDESDWVASDIHAHQFKHRGSWSRYAVLYRGNAQSRSVERALRAKRIPYIVSGGASFFDRSEIKDVVAYLRLLVNPRDDAAFMRVVNTPRRDIGPVTLQKLAAYARSRRCSLMDACFELGLEAALGRAAHARVNRFATWYTGCREVARRASAQHTVNHLLDAVQYDAWLMETSDRRDIGLRRCQHVRELVEWIERIPADADGSPPDLDAAVAHLALMDRLEDDEDTGDAVRLMTLHASKGLEFPFVYLVGFEEELLPHRSSIEEDTVEEERRLCYVGITRAQERLTLTRATKRARFGDTMRTQTSRFFAELPSEDIEVFGSGTDAETVTEQRGREALADLRAMLKSN
ncbi:MAG: UvrD-helicase domain-containing protein [Pseudomonadota bacterium]